jgi:uncharacterized membrane protein HdeD (DUF308 family)
MNSKCIVFIIVGTIAIAFGFSFVAQVLVEVTSLNISQTYGLVTGSFAIVIGFTLFLPAFLSLSKQVVGVDNNES